jgi:hypothetical protein
LNLRTRQAAESMFEKQMIQEHPQPVQSQSLGVTQEERAAMVALAEVFRDIFLQQSRLLETNPKALFDIDSNLTGGGKLLLQ